MALPRSLARFNLRVTNPILGRVAPWMPGFAIVTHVGRRSGVTRQTPVNVFRHGEDEYVFALMYGVGSQWVRNVQAAGACTIRTRGRDVRLVDPRVVHDPARRMLPAPVRIPVRAAGVEDFLLMTRA